METKKRTRRGGKAKKLKLESGESVIVEEFQVQEPRDEEPQIEFQPETEKTGITLDVNPVENDVRQYFTNVERMLEEQEFEGPEDFEVFVSNVFTEVDGKEAILAADFETSRIFEKLLRASSDVILRIVADRLNGQYHDLMRHQFASHVVQTLLFLASETVSRELSGTSSQPTGPNGETASEPNEQSELPLMENTIGVICEQLKGHWKELLVHTFASHVLRTLLNLLAGQTLASESQMRSKKSLGYNKHYNNESVATGNAIRVPSSFKGHLSSIVDELISNTDQKEMQALSINMVANPVLQLLVAMPEVGTKLGHSFIYIGGKPSPFFPMLLAHKVGSHLVEKIVIHASPEDRQSIYDLYFKESFKNLVFNPIANFIIQRFVGSITEADLFDQVLTQLEPIFEKALFENRSGLIVETCKMAIKFPSTQSRVYQCLLSALQVTEDTSKLIELILYLKTSTRYNPDMVAYSVTLHGSLLLQHILQFTAKHCTILVKNLLDMSTENWMKWKLDPTCSRIIEVLFDSPTVPLKLKKLGTKKLMGQFVSLSMDKYGSHMVDKAWISSGLESRIEIASELLLEKPKLMANFHGKFVIRNCKIELFQRRRDEWESYQRKQIAKLDPSYDEATFKKSKKSKKTDEIDELFAKR